LQWQTITWGFLGLMGRSLPYQKMKMKFKFIFG
jgi:hypothetical protein